jgi:segregation and condensation protein A
VLRLVFQKPRSVLVRGSRNEVWGPACRPRFSAVLALPILRRDEYDRTPCGKKPQAGRMVEYKVQLNVFEGPLDLLLYLIKKEEVDIYEVNLTKIATQFIEYVEMMRRLDLDIAGEFLVMAATLMYIKSRELLPVDQQATTEEEEEALDPRWDLIRQLVEYKKFKDMAGQLQEWEAQQDRIYPHLPGKPELATAEQEHKSDVSLLDLLNAVNAVLKRFLQPENVGVIAEDKWSVSEKIELLLGLLRQHTAIKFSELFLAAHSRSEVIATFLALLELIRLKQLAVAQSEAFGEIEITKATPPPPTAPPAEPAPAAEPAAPTAPQPAEPILPAAAAP